jgi:DivIVA domain-containing protein
MARIPRRLRGYRRPAVDAALVRIAGTLGAGEVNPPPISGEVKARPISGEVNAPPITAEEARELRFKVGIRGYDRRIVDGLLSERIRELEAHERGGAVYSARHARSRAPSRFSPVGADWLVGWISSAQFGVVRTRTGYDERDVDDFLTRVVAGLRGDAPPVSARDVRDSKFRTVRFGSGYEEREVDRFLEQLASALDGLKKG